jgi:hypothetical protein
MEIFKIAVFGISGALFALAAVACLAIFGDALGTYIGRHSVGSNNVKIGSQAGTSLVTGTNNTEYRLAPEKPEEPIGGLWLHGPNGKVTVIPWKDLPPRWRIGDPVPQQAIDKAELEEWKRRNPGWVIGYPGTKDTTGPQEGKP